MRIEKYKMLLSAARNAAPEYQEVFYRRAYLSAEESYGANSPEVIAVLLAMNTYLEEKGQCEEALRCQQQARSIFRGS
jgi:hypothetical protein